MENEILNLYKKRKGNLQSFEKYNYIKQFQCQLSPDDPLLKVIL